MFSMDFLRGENEKLEKTIPQQVEGADIKCNSPRVFRIFIPNFMRKHAITCL